MWEEGVTGCQMKLQIDISKASEQGGSDTYKPGILQTGLNFRGQ